jgi:CheY-like chemotaxis protein
VLGRILLVEDDESVATSLSRLLRSAGYACTRVASAEQAIEYLTRDIPRIIISDLNLSDMDGESFLRRLRADARTRAVPFIMYTGSCEHDSLDTFREAGATAYCSKSKPEELLRLIAEIG